MHVQPFAEPLPGCPDDHWLSLPLAPRIICGIRYGYPSASPVPLAEAVRIVADFHQQGRQVHGLEINGPGDGLADPELLMTTVKEVRKAHPDLPIRILTCGLGSDRMTPRIVGAGISEVIFRVEAVDPGLLTRIYAWIRPGRKTIPLEEACGLLLREQERGIDALRGSGIRVGVRTTVFPGVNEQHLGEIARTMARMGCASISLQPYTGCPSGVQEEPGSPVPCDEPTLVRARALAARFLPLAREPVMGVDGTGHTLLRFAKKQWLPRPSAKRPRVAVVSSNGMDIDLHLGQADRLLIYGPRDDGLACLLESRRIGPQARGEGRWQALAREHLHDCFAVLAANAGQAPKKILAQWGVRVLVCGGDVEGVVDSLFEETTTRSGSVDGPWRDGLATGGE